MDAITIGDAQSYECDTLVYIAQLQGYFTENGLKVTIKNYTSGAAAVNELLAGNLDVAATAEFPLVRNALNGQNISALACIGKFQLQDLIGRRDLGIETVADLAGKKIGVPMGTVSQFYVARFLDIQGLSLQNVTLVNVTPPEAGQAIANGTIDALVIWQPYAYQIETQLGANAIVWSPQSSQATYILEVAKNDWIASHPNEARRFIRALSEAEDYLIGNPSQAKATMQTQLNYTDEYMQAIWSKNEILLSLDQGLVAAMEDEARWMINNNITAATVVPNFLNNIYLDSLIAEKPGAVTLIH